MSVTDQAEVDALLAEAESLAVEISGSPANPVQPPPVSGTSKQRVDFSNVPPAIGRILALEVPVIVQLAARNMTMREVLDLNVGAVIEFDKRFDAELALVVSNCCIGLGHAVKVGENFGLRVTRIGTIYEKIRALGD